MSLFTYQTPSKPRQSAPRIEESSQPWTTARCHRLLRPLVSRIASLRKESSTAAQTTAASNSNIGNKNDIQRHEVSDGDSDWLVPRKKRPRLTYSQRRGADQLQSHSGRQEQLSSDMNGRYTNSESATQTRPQIVKKTYKSLRPETQRRVTAPGEFMAPTPLLQRARRPLSLSQAPPNHDAETESHQAPVGYKQQTKVRLGAQRILDGRLAMLRESRPHTYTDLEAIFRSLEALLKATAPQNSSRTRGPRSLLDLCLRKVPHYISELEAWERSEAEKSGRVSTLDEINTSAHIYEYLESIGANVGWRHLRVVVRADGINAIREGISEELFDDVFSQLLIDLCIHLGATSEAEDLISILVDRPYPQPTSLGSNFAESSNFLPLTYLNLFALKHSHTSSFLFRLYTKLLSQGDLPQDWLATPELEHIWSLAARDLATTTLSEDVVNFMITSISLLCSRTRIFAGSPELVQLEQDMAITSLRRLTSALSLLVSISLLGETQLLSPGKLQANSRDITLNGNKLKHIIRASASELAQYKRGRSYHRLDYLYLALFFASTHIGDEEIEANVKGCIRRLSLGLSNCISAKEARAQDHYDTAARFIASISRGYGRGTLGASHNYECLNALFTRLRSLHQDQETAVSFLDGLKAAAAFFLAQQTGNVRDLIYAEGLNPNGRFDSGTTAVSSHETASSSGVLFTGYRWEETIGEWVTVSPGKRAVPTKRRKLRSSVLANRDSEQLETDTAILAVEGTDITLTAQPEDTNNLKETRRIEVILPHPPTCEIAHHGCVGQHTKGILLRKRPRRLLHDITNTNDDRTEDSPVLSESMADMILKQSNKKEVSSAIGKENQAQETRLLAKKPRRSGSKRVLLSMLSSRREGDGYGSQGWDSSYSDDELCV
ncbi:hypothetical protein F5Y16DRAFT_181032 [Xylariaceae sp. FL0255]|nr:hypothetical protein F5Y16DRAFT_181032 [Xylariaceae sp. FL0255]